MLKQMIPWATSIVTLYAMYVIGKKRWWGWLIGLCNQVLWVTLAVAFKTWGLLPLTVALIVLYTKNLLGWRADEAIDVTP